MATSSTSIPLSSLARPKLLRQYIYYEILSETLDRNAIDDDIFAQLKANFRRNNGLTDDQAEQEFRLQHGMGPADLRWQIELPYRVNLYCRDVFLSKAEARFLRRKGSLDSVTYSLIRLRDADLARELYIRIAEGESSFADLARDYSEGTESKANGIVGPVPLDQGHPVLVQHLRSAKPGCLIAPFQIEQWWLITRLESYQPAVLDDTMRQRMAQELFDEWIQAETTSKIAALGYSTASTTT